VALTPAPEPSDGVLMESKDVGVNTHKGAVQLHIVAEHCLIIIEQWELLTNMLVHIQQCLERFRPYGSSLFLLLVESCKPLHLERAHK
jgi:hypothetical protein